ncbi:hypothetical protein Cyast_0758 [Cyanobacterium stanieri PCC 7202]|uniref:DUF3782 domain-containing protein n=1 Tax=Cyanobacterium stanieri (strain ATCC 29140 / PCC 7202) TaxID=292563 RepID=K9YK18_CYASC|nr:hypothetical protein Cyast_0758 [Cyanobacterium stanieri PCC 7202]
MATTIDDVWAILAEVTKKQAELVVSQKETEQLLKEQSQEMDKRFQETDRRFKETDKQIKRLSKEIGALGGRWGRFVENMVAPACETIFASRGIPVHQVSQRVKKKLDHKTLEIDVLVTNENHVLVVEIKSSLSVEDVKEFVADLQEFREFFPEYKEKQLYGAVAGIELEGGVDKYAYRQGLFVLAQAGETVGILNGDGFEPRSW